MGGIEEGYIAASDTDSESGNWGVSLQWLRRLFEISPVRQQIVWLDCCYSAELLNFSAEEANPGYKGKARDRCFIAASREYEVAYEEVAGNHGVLTGALLRGLVPTQQFRGEINNLVLTESVNGFLKGSIQSPIYANFGSEIVLTRNLAPEKIPEPIAIEYCPYKGLEYFDYNDEDPKYFFGRDSLINQLIEKVRVSNFLAVLGASGSGKSSVVRAGLLHQLEKGQRLSGSNDWPIHDFRPGEHPLYNLASAIVDPTKSGECAFEVAKTVKILQENGADELYKLITEKATYERMILVVDQFEEVFTLCQDDEERHQFFECLLRTLELAGNKLCLIIVMRADFFGKCTEQDYSGLAKKIQEAIIPVIPMNRKELEQAIIEPAKKVGLEIESELVTQIIDDVLNSPGSLPLLQYTLTELWQQRNNNRLELSQYSQIGGIKGSLAKHADQVYEKFSEEEQQHVKRIFLELTQPGEGTEDTRRQVKKQELVTSPHSLIIVDKLIKENLLVSDVAYGRYGSVDQVEVIDVVHEALIRYWPLLRDWIDENRDTLRFKRRIDNAVRYWDEMGKPEGLLWQYDSDLVRLTAFLQQHKDEIAPLQERFLRESIEAKAQKEIRKKQQDQLKQDKEIGDIQILVEASIKQFKEHDELEALWSIIKAAYKLQQIHKISIKLRQKIVLQLRIILYNIREKDRFEALSHNVTSILFTPKRWKEEKSYLLASGYDNKELWLLDVNNYKKICNFESNSCGSIRFDSNKERVAIILENNRLCFLSNWNTRNVLENNDFHRYHVEDPTSSILNSTDRFIIIGNKKGDIWIYDISNSDYGQPIYKSKWNPDMPLSDCAITALAVKQKDQIEMLAVAAGRRQSIIKLWNIKEQLNNAGSIARKKRQFVSCREIIGPNSEVISLSFNNNTDFLAAASGKMVNIYSLIDTQIPSGNPSEFLDKRSDDVIEHFAPVKDVTFSPDDQLTTLTEKTKPLYTGSYIDSEGEKIQTIHQWNLSGAIPKVTRLTSYSTPIWGISFSPDGRFLVVEDVKGNILLRDIKATTTSASKKFSRNRKDTGMNNLNINLDFGFTVDSKRFIYKDYSAGNKVYLKIWNLEKRELEPEILLTPSKTGFSMSGDYLKNFSASVVSYASSDVEMTTDFDKGGTVNLQHFEDERLRPFLIVRDGVPLPCIYISCYSELKEWLSENNPQLVDFSLKYDLLTFKLGESISVWKFKTRERTESKILTISQGENARFSPDGNFLVCRKTDGSLIVFDMGDAKEILNLKLNERSLFDFCSDSNMLIVYDPGMDKFNYWDLSTRQKIQNVESFSNKLHVEFWSDGGGSTKEESGSQTNPIGVFLWDYFGCENSQQIKKFQSCRTGLTRRHLARTHDGSMFAEVGYDNSIRLWDLTLGLDELFERGCKWLKCKWLENYSHANRPISPEEQVLREKILR